MSEAISLFQLNTLLKEKITTFFSSSYWIKAEISECKENLNGHCYLELIEKDSLNEKTIAKARANIWANTYKMLKPYFESTTNQSFTAGIKILIAVSVEYHEVYGMSLTIKDIDPSYTIGDMTFRRMEIINRLKEEGVFEMNKELILPPVPNKIALISSATAAGYEDFIQQLSQNKKGFQFYHTLFPAVMQGEKTEESIIKALEEIYQHANKFDVVVIIRGGGASADLSSFDNYNIAYHCTQFPLPIFAGIGHHKDLSIVDLVAHTSLKTPTAVAEKLIEILDEQEEKLKSQINSLYNNFNAVFNEQKNTLALFSREIYRLSKQKLENNDNLLKLQALQIKNSYKQQFFSIKNTQDKIGDEFKKTLSLALKEENNKLNNLQKNIQLISPDFVLSKGYSITYNQNKEIIKNTKDVSSGEEIITQFKEGSIHSTVK